METTSISEVDQNGVHLRRGFASNGEFSAFFVFKINMLILDVQCSCGQVKWTQEIWCIAREMRQDAW